MSIEQIGNIAGELILGDEEARELLVRAMTWLQVDPVRARRTRSALRRVLPGDSHHFHILLFSAALMDDEVFERLLTGDPIADSEVGGLV